MGWLMIAATLAAAADAPLQPVPFSHRIHTGAGQLTCAACHTNPDPGVTEGIPQAAACMQCHATVKPESAAIRKLAGYAKKRRNIPWVRVYAIPDFVLFSHRQHVTAGATCEDCHGGVTASDQVSLAPDFTMVKCVACHNRANIRNACGVCHDLK